MRHTKLVLFLALATWAALFAQGCTRKKSAASLSTFDLSFLVQPQQTTGGVAITPPVQVAITEPNGAPITSAVAITITLGNNPSNGVLAGTTTVTAVNGVASFSDLRIDRAGAGYRLAASASGVVNGTSAPFDVVVGPASTLTFDIQPTAGVISQPLPQFGVGIADAGGNIVTTASGTVTIALGTAPGGAVLSGTLSGSTIAGVATFNDVRVDTAGNYTLGASSTGLTGATSDAFQVFVGGGILPVTISGTVTQRVGTTDVAGVNSTVNVFVVDDDGAFAFNAGSTTTNAQGFYSVTPTAQGNLRYAVQSVGPNANTTFTAFVGASLTNQPVNEVTRAAREVIGLVIGTPGGRSITHYTGAEIDQIVTAASTAVTTAGTNRNDPTAMQNRVITSVGGLIADLSEGTFATVRGSPPAPLPPFDRTTPLVVVPAVPIVALDDAATPTNQWDILEATSAGAINDGGGSDAYDVMFALDVDVGTFAGGAASAEEGRELNDGREIVLGPETLSGLTVTRKVFVPATVPAFCRFLEVLTNPTAAPITVNVAVYGNLGSDEPPGDDFAFADLDSDSVFDPGEPAGTSDGDELVEAGDLWLVNHQDSSDPALGFFFRGATTAVKTDDDVQWSFTNVTVPAGQTVRIVSWGVLQQGAQPAAFNGLVTLMGQLQTRIPTAYFEGLTAAEIASLTAQLTLPSTYAYVQGLAGAMGPRSTITCTNQTTTEVATAVAHSDGAFQVELAQGISANDQIRVQSTDGTDVMITAP